MNLLLSHLPDLQTVGNAGYVIVFIAAFLEAFVFTGMFTPGTIVVILAGGLAAHGYYSFPLVVLASILASILGDGVSYEIGIRGQNHLERSPFLKKHIDRARPFFQKHQKKSIILGRFIGPTRPVIPFLAGVADMQRLPFYLIMCVSGALWSFLYAGAGYVFGTAWKIALIWSSRVFLFIIVVVLLFLAFAWLWRWILVKGKPYLDFALRKSEKLRISFVNIPFIKNWIHRHSKISSFIAQRFHTHHFSGLPLTWFMISIVASAGIFLAIVDEYVTGDPLTQLDVRLVHLLYIFRSDILLTFFRGVTLLGDWRLILVCAAAATLILLYRRHKTFAVGLWTTIAASGLFITGAKLLFHRPRPLGLIPAMIEESYSFPSGHATLAAAFYGFLAYLYVRESSEWKKKVSAVFLAVIIVVGIDFSRLYLGVHYLSDVLAGNFVGLTTLLLSISVCEWLLWKWREMPLKSSCKHPAEIVTVVVLCQCIIVAAVLALRPSHWSIALPQMKQVLVSEKDLLVMIKENRFPKISETLLGRTQVPISFIIVGKNECIEKSLIASRWTKANEPSPANIFSVLESTITRKDATAPIVSPFFYNTLPTDLSFEKLAANKTGRFKHHVRLWEVPFKTDQGSVFVATTTLDHRVRFGVTQRVNPDIDAERDLLLAEFKKNNSLLSHRLFQFIQPVPKNLVDDVEYFTNGRAVFAVMTGCQ